MPYTLVRTLHAARTWMNQPARYTTQEIMPPVRALLKKLEIVKPFATKAMLDSGSGSGREEAEAEVEAEAEAEGRKRKTKTKTKMKSTVLLVCCTALFLDSSVRWEREKGGPHIPVEEEEEEDDRQRRLGEDAAEVVLVAEGGRRARRRRGRLARPGTVCAWC
eukprot:SAG22_NODE_205_length_15308_cov_20.539023_17_plen_163_part_00